MLLPLRALLPCLPLLLAACAGPQPVKTQRWPLAYGVYLEADVPAEWSVEASIDANTSRTTLLRLTAREPGTTQLHLVPKLMSRPSADPRADAARELATSRACDGIGTTVDQRALERGGATASCSRPAGANDQRLLPVSAGVLVRGPLVASYALHNVTDSEAAAATTLVHSMRVLTIQASP